MPGPDSGLITGLGVSTGPVIGPVIGSIGGLVLAMSGLIVIFGRRIAGSSGQEWPASEPTRLFIGLSLLVVGHQAAAHALPAGTIGPVIPLGLAWIPGVMIVLGLLSNVWMDRRDRAGQDRGE